MKRNVWIYGLILGVILTGNMLYMVNKIVSGVDFEGNAVLGYAFMVAVFSLTFFGIRNYRNKELNGSISMWKAFKTGALIAFVGSSMYVIVGLSYYYLFVPDFIDKWTAHVLTAATKAGATATELAAKTKEMAAFKEMYKNPIFAILISYAEVLPIGLVVAFISSLFLKKK